jgi:hypothetical protein
MTNMVGTSINLDPTLHRLESTVQAIMALLSRETAAVKAIDLTTFSTLQAAKNTLLDTYQADIKTLVAHKDHLKTLPEATKTRIRDMERDLSVARMANLSALERAGKSFTRLRDRIVAVARDTALRSGAPYNAAGMLHLRTRKTLTTGTVSDRA